MFEQLPWVLADCCNSSRVGRGLAEKRVELASTWCAFQEKMAYVNKNLLKSSSECYLVGLPLLPMKRQDESSHRINAGDKLIDRDVVLQLVSRC